MEGAKLLELPEDEAHHLPDLLVGVEADLPGGPPRVAYGQGERELAAAGLSQLTFVQALLEHVQLRLAHGSFEAEEQAVVVLGGIVDAVEVRDQGRKKRADLQELMPVLRRARKTGHLHAQDEPHVVEADLRNQPRESLPAFGAASGFTQILIDDEDAPLWPAHGDGAAHQAILEVGRLAMVHHLLDGRLAHVHHRQPLQVPICDLLGARRGKLRKTIHGHHLPPVKPWCRSPASPSGVPGVCSAAPQDACGSAVAVPPRSVGTPSLEAGGNQSVRHGARSCRLSAFREGLSLCASSTIPSSPASPMVGRAGGFVCTGALWLGNGADDRLDRPAKEDEQRLRATAATSEAFIYVAMSRLMLRRLAR